MLQMLPAGMSSHMTALPSPSARSAVRWPISGISIGSSTVMNLDGLFVNHQTPFGVDSGAAPCSAERAMSELASSGFHGGTSPLWFGANHWVNQS